jgi:hypothetical protein
MKNKYRNWGLRTAALIAVVSILVFFGQLISFSWMAITGTVSFAVWMMIWLWPERMPQRAARKSTQAAQRLVANEDAYTRRN